MQNHQIKAVIFDIGRVLIKVDLTRGIFKYTRQSANSDLAILENLFRDQYYQAYGTGNMQPQDFYAVMRDKLRLDIDYATYVREWCDIFDPMPGMDHLFREVSERHPVGLLSDIDPLHWSYLREMLPHLQQVEKPTLSFEIGALKPDPVCYELAAQNVNANPAHCLFIDDRQINVDGALEFGMHAILFNDTEDLWKQLKALAVL